MPDPVLLNAQNIVEKMLTASESFKNQLPRKPAAVF